MSVVTTYTLLQYLKSRIKDSDNVLFEDAEYERYLEQFSENSNYRRSVWAQGRKTRAGVLDGSGYYGYRGQWCHPCGGLDFFLMDVQIAEPNASDDYRIDEGARRITNISNPAADDRLQFEVSGISVCLRTVMAQIFRDAAASPTKTAVYLNQNGLTVDSRDSAQIMRTHAQQIMGAH